MAVSIAASTVSAAAENLREIFAETDQDECLVRRAELALFRQTFAVVGKLPNARRVSGKPGKTVNRVLLAFQRVRGDFSIGRNPGTQAGGRVGEDCLGGGRALFGKFGEFRLEGR